MLRAIARGLGKALRETGIAAERQGARLQQSPAVKEAFSRHRTVMPLGELQPEISVDAYVAPNAAVIGDVFVGDKASVWYSAVVRGDLSPVSIGAFTNVQDRAVITSAPSSPEQSGAVNIGNYVTIGHGAVLHGCTVEDEAVIGMGAIVQEGAVVGKQAIVAAGAVVEPGTKVPDGQLWAGNPATFKREATDRERESAIPAAKSYNLVANAHKDEFLPEGTQWREAENLSSDRKH